MPPRRRTKAEKPKAGPKSKTSAKCRLLELGVEVQAAIVEHVDVLGLVRLQRTCKHFHKLLATSDKAVDIWKEHLRDQSAVHGLFWPSFKDLETATNFRDAATASLRFSRVYDKTGHHDSFPSSSHSVKLEGNFESAPMHLVPGGRYVVLLGRDEVSVVDLHSDPDEDEDPIVCKYETERPLNVPEGCVWVAENGKKVYILQEYTSPITQRVRSRDRCRSTVSTYTLIELSLGEDGEVSLGEKVTLPVVHWAESLRVHPVLDGCIAFIDDDMGVTFVWNPAEMEYAALRVGCEGSETSENVTKVFSKGSFIFFANDEIIQGVEVPYFQELEEDESVIMADLKSRAVSSYSVSLDASLSSAEERCIVNPAGPDLPVVYDVVTKDPETDTLKVHRHILEFDPESPDDIELKLVEVSKSTLEEGASQLFVRRQMQLDGRVATLWTDEMPEAAYVSLSPALGTGGKVTKTKLGLARLDEEGDEVFEFGCCFASGIVVGLKESSIEVYELV